MSDCVSGSEAPFALGPTDRHLVALTQAGLPLVPRPYLELARQLGIDEQEVLERMNRMLAAGVIRRIAAVPNHYKLGFTANGMTVWDVNDAVVRKRGEQIGALECVSHCYARPRHPPLWPYNLFAMVHGRNREEVADQADHIAELLGSDCRGHDILFSTRILKKTGLRIARDPSSGPSR